jgi:NTE family protein
MREGYKVKIGVALSGGGLRGASHIGILKALEGRKIPIDMICGTSMGGVVAALYASGYSSIEIVNIFRTLNLGFLSEDNFYKKIKDAF